MRPGTLVNVKWEEGWYMGTVQRPVKRQNTYSSTVVEYMDGDVQAHDFTKEEHHVLALPEDPLCFTKLCEFAPLYLKCPVCLDIFETPRTLKTCLHTFCANCLGTSKCVICAVPFTDSDVGSNPIIAALSSSLRPEIDAVVALQTLATNTETVKTVQTTPKKAQGGSGKWRCRKCGKKKPLRQMRCGVGCA